MGALIGVSGVLVGSFMQWLVKSAQYRREYMEGARMAWGEAMIDLFVAGASARRAQNENERGVARGQLDAAWARVYFTCPLELTRPVNSYLMLHHAFLKGYGVDLEEKIDAAEQDINLVYRRVARVNHTLPRKYRGKRARLDLAPEYR